MIEKTVSEISNMCSGSVLNIGYNDSIIKGVSTDSRTIKEGNLFIPLVGDSFDGHEYALQALEQGASAILWEKKRFLPSTDLPVILVNDTYDAMVELAKNYRLSLNCDVIAITGSNGKTTTKDILYSLLKEKYKVQKTLGNLNNEFGLPQTIFQLDENCEIAVLELGTDDFGDIAHLTRICLPDMAIITNIGDSHLLNLKTKENIARAKLEILEGLAPNGLFFYNGDDLTLKEVVKEFKLPDRTFTYGVGNDNDFKIEPINIDSSGVTFSLEDHIFTIPLLGKHQIYNGAIAIILSEFFKLDYSTIAKGLKNIDLTGMRNELIHLNQFDILDDSYKSNPQSLDSCLELVYTLNDYDRKISIIGDMLELGDDEISLHEKVGDEINSDKIDYLFTIGNLSKYIYEKAKNNFPENHVFYFDNQEDLFNELKEYIIPKTLIMIKASRAMHLENLVESLEKHS